MGMMLYFYILETAKDGKPVLKSEPYEAENKDGLIRPAKGVFFPPAVGGFTLECHLGKVIGTKNSPVVVLREPDLKKARQLLAQHVQGKIEHYQERTEAWNRMLKAVGA